MSIDMILQRVKAEIEAVEMTAKRANLEHMLVAITNIDMLIEALQETAEKEEKTE